MKVDQKQNVDKRQVGEKLSKADLKASLQRIKNAKQNKQAKVTNKTKVNEQELFASFIHKELKAEKNGSAKKFLQAFKENYKNLKSEGSAFAIIKAARRALSEIVNKENLIPKDMSKEIRKYAAGMAQLDDNILLQAKADKCSDSNPKMGFHQAYEKVQNNDALTDTEHGEFKKAMREAIKAEENKTEETKDCPVADCPVDEPKDCKEVEPNKTDCKPDPEPEKEPATEEIPVVKVNYEPSYKLDADEFENLEGSYKLEEESPQTGIA